MTRCLQTMRRLTINCLICPRRFPPPWSIEEGTFQLLFEHLAASPTGQPNTAESSKGTIGTVPLNSYLHRTHAKSSPAITLVVQ
jgi:hypothetical protein